ncbi:unnamed protein product [Microthlaspi erraticum]|uniref:Uncharacterized protein n=1 Tax=Microthlaspi erraticum TaxID=1685480 RepID=A0A6D2JVS3_9BRAS|nr:unnamed protein product [Microthlaspi erraticum]
MSRGQAVQAFATISRARPHRANREASPRGRAAQLTSYNQKSEDCPDGSIENQRPTAQSGWPRNDVPRSAKLVRPTEVSAKVQTTRPITHHDPGNMPAVGHATTHAHRARPKRASREVTPRGRATPRVPRTNAPSDPGNSRVRPKISSAKFQPADRQHPTPTVPTRPRPDCPADRPARPSQRRGRPEALFEAQTYVFKPGLTLAASRKT